MGLFVLYTTDECYVVVESEEGQAKEKAVKFIKRYRKLASRRFLKIDKVKGSYMMLRKPFLIE